MMTRWMRQVGRLVIEHPGMVTAFTVVVTLFLYANIHKLRTSTDLTDMFGKNDPQWQAVSQMGKELGYGNQLFVLVQAPKNGTDFTSEMEEIADRLTTDMLASGKFKQARSGLQEEELLNIVRYFSWNFPAFAQPGQVEDYQRRLDPQQIHRNVQQASTNLVTPFSTLGANYFVADPLGLMGIAAHDSQGLSQFGSFDLTWGSGNRFFSKDHTALLILAEPNQSAMDYKFAGQVVQWTRADIAAISSEPAYRDTGVRTIAAGAYVYADEDHRFIERNIRRVSLISILGNLALCLLVYPSIPLLILSVLPTSLGILWTTGIASFYPGEVNLISLSFIAILAGLGDDQVVHFFNRVPQEWAKKGTLNEAVLRSFETTGASIVLCIVTAAAATAALAASGFKALAEFGFILTVGMFMMMFHTLLTIPALMQLWRRHFKPSAPGTITFRFLPSLAKYTIDFVERHSRLVIGAALGLFLLSLAMLPSVRMGGRFAIEGSDDSPAMVAQNALSAKFGIEGSPNILLISGSEDEALLRAEELTAGLEGYRQRGAIRAIYSPTNLLPSARTQGRRAASLKSIDFAASAKALQDSLREDGFRTDLHKPYLDRLRKLGEGMEPVTLESAAHYLPAGLLDNSFRRAADGRYIAAIAYYAARTNAAPAVPEAVLASWKSQYGPFVEFSYEKINSDMQGQILHDSRKALLWTAAAIILIVYLTFRNLRISLLVLMPIVFSIVVTFGLLRLFRHQFSFMSITAVPLIIGIGIDNGIHLVRRYQESKDNCIFTIARASGAALILSNMTTMIGFGALMASTFEPLAELGLVTCIGVALSLVGGLCVVPAAIYMGETPKNAL
ncbi:MAG TPA: MMPL family transporter [Acidobacteriaceae bacterium]